MSVSLLPSLDQWNAYLTAMSNAGTAGTVLSVVGAAVLLAGALLKSSGAMAGSLALSGPGLLFTLLATASNQWLPLLVGAVSVSAAAIGSAIVAAVFSIGADARSYS